MIPLPPAYKHNAKYALDRLGLTSVVCLDAGDLASYNGTSQQWTDTSGAGNHFNLGTTTGVDVTDPTFAGVAGAKTGNEYFSCDGGDFWTPAGAPTFDDTWHRDGGVFTIATVHWCASLAATACFFGNANSGTAEGLRLTRALTTGNITLSMQNGTASQNFNAPTGAVLNAWNYVAISVSENAGASGGNLLVNATAQAFNPNLTTPGVGNPAAAPQIGGRGGAGSAQPFQNGDRLAVFVASAQAWTPAQLASFRDIMRTRFPGL